MRPVTVTSELMSAEELMNGQRDRAGVKGRTRFSLLGLLPFLHRAVAPRPAAAPSPAAAVPSSAQNAPARPALPPELLREIQRLHFQTRRLADQGVGGRYRSAFRGTGVEFEEVREYVPGDDIRAIDWKVTARSRAPYVKVYREERELTVLVAVDVSQSTLTGTRGSLRAPVIARAGAVLTLIALNNNDKVGLVTWSSALESYHPPRKGRSAVWRVLHEVMLHPASTGTMVAGSGTVPLPVSPDISAAPGSSSTDLAGLFSFLSTILSRRAIIFVVSDFLAPSYERELSLLAARHDVNGVVVTDPADAELPRAGLVSLFDPESMRKVIIDSSDAETRSAYAAAAAERIAARQSLFRRHGVGEVELRTDRPFMPDLRRFLETKAHARARAHLQSR